MYTPSTINFSEEIPTDTASVEIDNTVMGCDALDDLMEALTGDVDYLDYRDYAAILLVIDDNIENLHDGDVKYIYFDKA